LVHELLLVGYNKNVLAWVFTQISTDYFTSHHGLSEPGCEDQQSPPAMLKVRPE
jgi:hypothetical protein